MTDPTRPSPIEMLILKMLISNGGEMYGLEMIKQSGKKLKRGTVYVRLSRMEDKGFIESRKEEPQPGARGLPRRLYKPAAHGVRTLQKWQMPASDLDAAPVGALNKFAAFIASHRSSA